MARRLPKPWYKKIIDKLSIKYGKDYRVIEHIVHYPFSFLKQLILDDTNNEAVRLRHLGVFFLRHPELKEIIYTKQFENLLNGLDKLVEAGIFETEDVAKSEIEAMSMSEVDRFYKNNVRYL